MSLNLIITTKHVHRLHPYKGKFIPQLVEYFIDDHIDNFKPNVYFKPGDIVLDPFCGSGTTLVQTNELGIHSIGIDISQFNCMISNVKLYKYNIAELNQQIREILIKLSNYEYSNNIETFELELIDKMNKFNLEHFPSPIYKYKLQQNEIDQDYGIKKKKNF